MRIKKHLIWLSPALLCACETSTSDFVLDPASFNEAKVERPPAVVEFEPQVTPLPLPGQLKPIVEKSAPPSLKPYERIDKANADAKIEPALDNFVNAVQVYPFVQGALYQLYAAPEQVTDIALQAGEQLISVSAGDTVRWVVGDTTSGYADTEQVHILVKPISSGLTTNLVITTDLRAYHLEMRSFNETYMAAVSWRYPQAELVSTDRKAKPLRPPTIERGLAIASLKFRYEIDGDKPHWRPLRAFDDGEKVYIQFPDNIAQGEAPPLFIVGDSGEAELVNYRVKGAYYIVDRLFAAAELRHGGKRQNIVRITRNDLKLARR